MLHLTGISPEQCPIYLTATTPFPPPTHTHRSTIEGILSDASAALDKVIPIPELAEMDALLKATIQATLNLLDQAGAAVTDGHGAKVGT